MPSPIHDPLASGKWAFPRGPIVVSGEMWPGAVSPRPRVRPTKKTCGKTIWPEGSVEVFCFAQDVSQPQPAKVVILSERGQEKSAKDASLSRIVLEKSATPVNSSEGLRLGMMLSQQAAGRRVLGLRKARASKSPGRVSSACTFFSTHQWPNGPQLASSSSLRKAMPPLLPKAASSKKYQLA